MTRIKKSNHNFSVFLIIIILFFTILTIYKLKSTKTGNLSTKAAPTSANCLVVDTYLCEALSHLNEREFISQVYGGTVSSFDGSSHIERIWGQDNNGRSFQFIKSEGKETDSVLYSPNEALSKDISTGKWKKEIVTNPERSSMIEQVGIEEDLEHFFNQDPNLSHYTFEKKGSEMCFDIPCIKYQAHDSLISDEANQEFLYFDAQTKMLIKYEKISKNFEITYTFKLGAPPNIELPVVQE